MLVLFFGTRARRRVIDQGTFDCPYCLVPRSYERVASRTWFHLFWVLTLFPVGSERESVRCTVCGGEWAPHALTRSAPGPAGPGTAPTDPAPGPSAPPYGSG